MSVTVNIGDALSHGYGLPRLPRMSSDTFWDKTQAKPGLMFGGSAAFTLPNGAERSPDIAWIAEERWQAVPPKLRRRFPHISPDFQQVFLQDTD